MYFQNPKQDASCQWNSEPTLLPIPINVIPPNKSDADDVIKFSHQLLASNALEPVPNPIAESCNSGSKFQHQIALSRREEVCKMLGKAGPTRRSVKSLEPPHCPALHLCIASPLHDPRQATSTSTQPPIPSSKLLSLHHQLQHQHHIPNQREPHPATRSRLLILEDTRRRRELLTEALCAMMYWPQSSSRSFHTK